MRATLLEETGVMGEMKGTVFAKTALAAGILLGAAIPTPQLWGSSAYAQSSTDLSIESGLDHRNYILDNGTHRAEGQYISSAQEPSPFIWIPRDRPKGEHHARPNRGLD